MVIEKAHGKEPNKKVMGELTVLSHISMAFVGLEKSYDQYEGDFVIDACQEYPCLP